MIVFCFVFLNDDHIEKGNGIICSLFCFHFIFKILTGPNQPWVFYSLQFRKMQREKKIRVFVGKQVK